MSTAAKRLVAWSTERPATSWALDISLILLLITLAIKPTFYVGNIFVCLTGLPILLLWQWRDYKKALLGSGFSAGLALAIWGRAELLAWITVYANTTLIILFLYLTRRTLSGLYLAKAGLAYWLLIGTPLTFLIQVEAIGDTGIAWAEAGLRTMSGLVVIALAQILHLTVILLVDKLPRRFFGSLDRLTMSLPGTAELMIASMIIIPILVAVMAGIAFSTALDSKQHAQDAQFVLRAHFIKDRFGEPVLSELMANGRAIIQPQHGVYIDKQLDCAAPGDIKLPAERIFPPSPQHQLLHRSANGLLPPRDWLVWAPDDHSSSFSGQFKRLERLYDRLITTYIFIPPSPQSERAQCWTHTSALWKVYEPTATRATWSVIILNLFLLLVIGTAGYFSTIIAKPLEQLINAFDYFSHNQIFGQTTTFEFIKGSRALEFNQLKGGFQKMERNIIDQSHKLKKLNESYELLLELTPSGFATIDDQRRLLFTSSSMREMIRETPNLLTEILALHTSEETSIRPISIMLGRKKYSYLTAIMPRKGINDEPDGYWIMATDLTDIKATEAQLIQAQKMATLGEMATGMAHEINQPLQTIRLASANVERQLQKSPVDLEKIKAKIQSINTQVYRVASLVKHMKSFGRDAGNNFEWFSPEEAIHTLTEVWHSNYAASGVTLKEKLEAGEDIKLLGNKTQFEQVIINLLENAKDAAVERKLLVDVFINSKVMDNSYVLTVIDQSGGIPEDIIDQIFTPFFTTKDPDKGTGIGLSISYTIISDMKGTLSVHNTEVGAEFTITLPLDSEQNGIQAG